MSHRDTDQPHVDRDLLDQLVRENGLTPYYINDAERQGREAAREWLNENVFDWTLPEHEIQLASEGSGGGGHWDGSMPVRIHTFDGVDNGYRSGHYLHYTIAAIARCCLRDRFFGHRPSSAGRFEQVLLRGDRSARQPASLSFVPSCRYAAAAAGGNGA